MRQSLSFSLNGEQITVEVETHRTLLYLLREVLGLMGTKEGCGMGECGSCTVIVNGRAVVSCLLPVMEVAGARVVTIEGLSSTVPPLIHPLQRAFVEEGAVQCGFCTHGVIMSAKALLDETPDPTEEQIKTAVEGNLCRCGAYVQIIRAVKAASKAGKDR
jgi:aerobic carbon-monoxide dehydrogenase small subunit